MSEAFLTTHATPPRTILHLDADAFFVGVEVAKNPKLVGRPVVTGEERGIVTALSYEAKALGVTRGMPTTRVTRQFPEVLILPGDYVSYIRYSERMFDVVRRYADDVEEYSIDECFADLTGLERPLKMSYREIAERMKCEIRAELGLSVSVGLAQTKVLAKVASKWKKPDGLTQIGMETAPAFLCEMPTGAVWGIGPKTAAHLKKWGVETAEQFRNKSFAWVRHHLSKPYETIWQELNGVSVMSLDPTPKTVYQSVQKTRTFYPPTSDKEFLLSELSKHIEDACAKARHFHLVPRKCSLFLKTQQFRYVTVSLTLPIPTNAPETLVAFVQMELPNMHEKGVLYRATGAALHELQPDAVSQKDLFGGALAASKLEAVHERIDALERKFGKRVVYLASTHRSLKRMRKGSDAEDTDRHLLFL